MWTSLLKEKLYFEKLNLLIIEYTRFEYGEEQEQNTVCTNHW